MSIQTAADTTAAPKGTRSVCPTCGDRTRAVQPITLDSMLTESALKTLTSRDGFRFCSTANCDIAYHNPESGAAFSRNDVRVAIGQKETRPARQVCYCFDYRVEDIAVEVRETGASTIPDTITEKCRLGLDRCEEMNPQGACCLGNVRQAYKAVLAEHAQGQNGGDPHRVDVESVPHCCQVEISDTAKPDAPPSVPPSSTGGRWATGGAMLAAAVSSACCWLPLVLVGFGASAAGVGGFFETYRPIMLGATGLLLGTGFYLVYFRKPHCEPGSACEVPNPKLQRLNKIMLWVAVIFVTALAFFPNYSGFLLGNGDGLIPPVARVEATASVIRRYEIAGMTCGGCAAHIQQAIGELEGIDQVSVSYDTGTADVLLPSDANVEAFDETIGAAIEAAGYQLLSVGGNI